VSYAGGQWQEEAAMTAAVDQVRAEAKARRQRLGVIRVRIDDDGQVRFSGAPWLPMGEELALNILPADNRC
jgi:hypothetical protein